MKWANLAIDLLFLVISALVLGNLFQLVKIPDNLRTGMIGMITAGSVVYSVVEIWKDIKEKPKKQKDVKINLIKEVPFKLVK